MEENSVNELPSKEEILQLFMKIEQCTKEEAEEKVGADTAEEIMANIKEFNLKKINNQIPVLNRSQRRKLAKKPGFRNSKESIGETAKKLTYIDLIVKLRELNAKREKENENTTKDD